jgi:hypothetical protein
VAALARREELDWDAAAHRLSDVYRTMMTRRHRRALRGLKIARGCWVAVVRQVDHYVRDAKRPSSGTIDGSSDGGVVCVLGGRARSSVTHRWSWREGGP